jgi:hypothetical protein
MADNDKFWELPADDIPVEPEPTFESHDEGSTDQTVDEAAPEASSDEAQDAPVEEIADTPVEADAVDTPVEEDAADTPAYDDAEDETGDGTESVTLNTIGDGVDAIRSNLESASSAIDAGNKELHELHRKVHTDFADRIRSMQEELDHYREVDKNRAFDPILTEIAMLYSNNAAILADEELAETNPRLLKRLKYLFADIQQVLESNGVQKQESNTGDKRNARYCQVTERVPTDIQEQHDTVASSKQVGFYIENRPLVKEFIDVYVYSPKAQEASQEQEKPDSQVSENVVDEDGVEQAAEDITMTE